MGSFLPHRPTMKARMLMTVEQARAERMMTASSMAGTPDVAFLPARIAGLLPRCAGSPGAATRSGHGIVHGNLGCVRCVSVLEGHEGSFYPELSSPEGMIGD